MLDSLLMGAIGDALGTGTFRLSRSEVHRRYPYGLRTFETPGDGNVLLGLKSGEITDGTDQLILLADIVGRSTSNVADRYRTVLQKWLSTSSLAKFVGNTTRRALQRPDASVVYADDINATNGAAMRIAPIGWKSYTAWETAVRPAASVASITHTGAGVIGACMIAAANAVAVGGGDLEAVLYAARASVPRAGDHARAPNSAKAMAEALEHAIAAGEKAKSKEDLNTKLEAFDHPVSMEAIGSVAAAFGFLVAAEGKPFEVVTLAANAGDDTHTTALMAGTVAGALWGRDDVPQPVAEQLVTVNEFLHGVDFTQVITDFTKR